jgi:hypothetical protein
MKQDLLEHIRQELRQRLARLAQAAQDAHAAATDPGSKAEGKYDTRSLEASYLASGQAKQVDETAATLRTFETLQLPDFAPGDAIDAGALVEADLDGETVFFLLAPAAGGLVVRHQDREITLLTPASALYRQLLGLYPGDSLESPPLLITEVV